MAGVSLKAALILGLLFQVTGQYCEDCRGAVTSFCALSCTCDMCEDDFGQQSYGRWNCNRCVGKITPWCGRWCWCNTCEKLSSALEFAASDDPGQLPAFSLGLHIAMCGSFTGLIVVSCLLIWKHATCNSPLHAPLLSTSQLDANLPAPKEFRSATAC